MATAYKRNGVSDGNGTSELLNAASWTKDQSLDTQAAPTTKYDKTAVLLLGWEPAYCDTGVAPELADLQDVLRGRYNFITETHLMHTKTSPQKQAFKHLSDFVYANDALRTLLVVYYAGHGYQSARGTNRLALSGKPIYDTEKKIAASFEWHEVERTLAETLSDVLVIFDCCQAGLICKSAEDSPATDTRIFQYLGACESEQLTESRGPGSFTSAIIWALKELAEESSFPITKLVHKVQAHKDFPPDQRPVLFGSRFHPASEIISLTHTRTPVPNATISAVAKDVTEDIRRGLPRLRMRLSWDLTDGDIIRGGGVLIGFVRDRILGCDAVTLLGMALIALFVVGYFTQGAA